MDMGFDAGLAIPTESAVSEVNMDTKTVIERFPYACHLFALSDRIGGYECCPNSSSLHQLRSLEIPAGNIVNLASRFIGLAILIHIDGQNILLLCFAENTL